MSAKATAKATVTGPGIERFYLTPEIALSGAITIAAAMRGQAGTLYVRHANGDPYGRVEYDDDGNIRIHAKRK